MSEQASGSRPRSSEEGPDGSPEDEEDVEDEVGDGDDDDDEEEEDEDDDDDEEEEEEEEEEDEDDEESEEEGESEEGCEGEEEEEEEEEEDKSAAAVDGGPQQPENRVSAIKVTESGVESVGPPDKEKACSDAEGLGETGSPATPNYKMPANLDAAGDCVVSAIRVDSKFSDEDESVRSADPKLQPGGGATGVTTTGHSPAALPATQNVALVGDGEDWSLTSEGHSGGGSWKDSEDEDAPGNRQAVAHGRNAVLSRRSRVSVEETGAEKSDAADSEVPPAKETRRRSSWGSSIPSEGSDREEGPPDPVGPGVESEVVPAQSAPQTPNEGSVWDSSSQAVAAPSKCNSPKSQLGEATCPVDSPLPSRPESQQRPESKLKESKSEWDSSSDDEDEGDHKKDPSATEDAEFHEERNRVSQEVSPLVSPEPQDRGRPSSQALEGNVKIATMSPKVERCLNDPDEDNSWDDGGDDSNNEVEGPVSPTQNRSESSLQTKGKELGVNPPPLKLGQDEADEGHDEDVESRSAPQRNSSSPTATPAGVLHESDGDKEDGYEGDASPPVSMIEGYDSDEDFSGDPEDPLFGADDDGSPKADEGSENSDSRAKRLRYDFASAAVRGGAAGDGDDSDSTMSDGPDEGPGERSAAEEVCEPRLTSYAPRGGDHDQVKADPCGHASAKVQKAAQSDNHGFSDEDLPTTDIDDVDVDSPREEEDVIKGPRVGKTVNVVEQVQPTCVV